jgi:isocitrate dehydrogenase kinase/phosphatase
VVFYDYDELCLLTDCQIRKFPEARDASEELEAEPWYYVADNDIFPEEFKTFLGLEGPLREAFVGAHADLFTVEFWSAMQERLRRGEVADIFPYKDERRLRR